MDDEFTNMHRALYSPSPGEAAGISERVQRLGAASSEMRRVLACIDQQVDLGRALLAPWRRLPPELWQKIFRLIVPCVWDGTRIHHLPDPAAEVCRAWRDLIDDIPSWAGAPFVFEINVYDTPPPAPGLGKVVKKDLAATGDQPLHIRIIDHMDDDMRSPLSYFSEEEGSQVWASICQSTHRWETVELRNIPDESLDILHNRQFPILHSLTHMHLSDIDPERPVNELVRRVQAFENARNLTTVSLNGSWAPLNLRLPLSWTRIASLSIDYYNDWDDESQSTLFAAVLSCSQTLRSCAIDGFAFASDWVGHEHPLPDTQPAMFPLLQELTLKECGVYFMSHISAPALRFISINERDLGMRAQTESWFSIDTMSLFRGLLDASHGCQALLAIRLIDTCIDGISHILGCLPQLTSLHIEDHNVRVSMAEIIDLVRALERSNDRPASLSFLPVLARLYISLDERLALDDSFLELAQTSVQSRCPASPYTLDGKRLACLETVDIRRAGLMDSYSLLS
ncbi:uncharacterized protein SCHCODRAFT_01295103 [Schizophyllum commune H4-8]|nr:uncharacterized protein SCHCODRAFT_01295103 [Schizophyllum commune H4-8]KAI5896913.1 hypothetical protein SCHCODRAFT_01295103 [Schizophyllum commune H4-8]